MEGLRARAFREERERFGSRQASVSAAGCELSRDHHTPEATRLLQHHPFPGAKLTALQDLLARGSSFRLVEGEELCTEGDRGNTLFVLLVGRIRVLRRDPHGQPRELAILEAPALIGHMSLIDGSPRSATCVAGGLVRGVELDRMAYQDLLWSSEPEGTALRRILLSSLSRQLTSGNARLRDLLSPPGEQQESEPAQPEKSEEERLLEVAGLLNGWKVDARGLNKMEVAEDEDSKRNPRNRRYPR